jgi:hypothetical protein
MSPEKKGKVDGVDLELVAVQMGNRSVAVEDGDQVDSPVKELDELFR